MKSLTPMQAASWVGRQSPQALGGVAAHLYAEFDGAITDIPRFRHAVDALYCANPMLRLHVTAEGQQHVVSQYPPPGIDDFCHHPPAEVQRLLADKRRRMENQQLLRDKGYPCEISLTLLPGQASRLHIDLDMIAADAISFRIVVEDLARFYQQPPPYCPPVMEVAWFRYLTQRTSDPLLLSARERDRAWWRQRLPDIPPAPHIACTNRQCQTRRMTTPLTVQTSHALQHCARQHHLTLSSLFLALFSLTMVEGFKQPALRINVPTFFRDPEIAGGADIVGDFSDLLIFSADLHSDKTLLHHCQRTMAQLHEIISHGGYSGVSVMRDLSRLHGQLQYSPIVFTAGFGIPGGVLFSEQVGRELGELGWVISQGPQVALDAQVAWMGDQILINWDVREDAFPPGQLHQLFTRFHAFAERLAVAPQHLHDNVSHWLAVSHRAEGMGKPLTALQSAYLLGRGEQWPLGGVAMHDFRTFRGHIEPAHFRRRLAELVDHFTALRTRIDIPTQQQHILPELEPQLEEIDLCDASEEDAAKQIRQLREHYQQLCHDPSSPPWRIILITLPSATEYLIFTSFDALILDGQGISHIIARLFDRQPLKADTHDETSLREDEKERERERERAKAWWQDKLAQAVTPSRLPWQQPLGEIVHPRWQRTQQTLDASHLKQLTRLGTTQGLFANTTLTAIVLDTLALWSEDEELTVGIPVAFPAKKGQPANQSTFIVVHYARLHRPFGDSAQHLQENILGGLQNLAWSGVDLARQLTPRTTRAPALPVILTNCLNWETLPANAPIRAEVGLTQTPQVALDIRLMHDEQRNLLLIADYVEQALAPGQVSAMLSTIHQRMLCMVSQGSLNVPTRDAMNYPHYRANTPICAAVSDDFLGRIAENLYSGTRAGVAVICGEQQLSWQVLGELVASMANGLLARQLVAGSVVAIYLPRSLEHIAISLACALLGIIRVPIDINSPIERTRYLLENCQPQLVIGDEDAAIPGSLTPEALKSTDVCPPRFNARSDSNQPAYYLYTSGTTGKPKCVVLNNRATANVLGQTLAHWQITERDVFISITPLHHDMSVFDVFASLSVGATLVLPARYEEKDAISWSRLIAQHRVTLWCSVPAILEMLLDCAAPSQLSSLRLVAQGGDYIKPATIRLLRTRHPYLRLISLGGPTETTIWSIWHEITASDVAQIPYGTPLVGNQYFICHDSGEHCPCGVSGRIHTAGVNLACGYLENGRLVQHDFVDVITPEGVCERTFRSGDIGYYRPDGVIMFANRINGYVKIRGVRVSLPEIEEALRQHPAIDDIVVLDYAVDDKADKSLGAVYLSREQTPLNTSELRNFAQRYLPGTHIPGRFILQTHFPLSANGKVDRHALRTRLKQSHSATVVSPSTPQQKVLEIYSSVMGQPLQPEWREQTAFLAMGLKFSHMPAVTEKLNSAFNVSLSVAALIKCKNATEVCALLQ
ncbi:TPA: amino acid adenylation domain-containing protein [Serratia fonticola]